MDVGQQSAMSCRPQHIRKQSLGCNSWCCVWEHVVPSLILHCDCLVRPSRQRSHHRVDASHLDWRRPWNARLKPSINIWGFCLRRNDVVLFNKRAMLGRNRIAQQPQDVDDWRWAASRKCLKCTFLRCSSAKSDAGCEWPQHGCTQRERAWFRLRNSFLQLAERPWDVN